MNTAIAAEIAAENFSDQNIKNYYTFHAYIYDLTRWTFLFGRKKVIDKIPILKNDVKQVLEIGCGTGHNLIYLSNRFPNANIVGVDISDEMIAKAKENTAMYPNVTIQKELDLSEKQGTFDIVLMSYVLTMMNPSWEFWVKNANNLLHEKGFFAVVDFHVSYWNWFQKHMSNHHVKMKAHILPELNKNYKTFHNEIKDAYLGVWTYFVFVGRKK